MMLERLQVRYAEPHRRYHTWSHVLACLEAKARITQAAFPEIELALLFHDAIYEPLAHDNEERSAELLVEECRREWLHDEMLRRASAMVLATRHAANAEPESEEACVVVDADLSILGASPDRFDAYEQLVRQEYSAVDDAAYACGRARFLRAMLERSSLFSTRRAQHLWEASARANIERSLRKLAGSAAT
jgi:predicted metal-dependent HD superfamily phosphohydrolase